jgi:uncharacterized protein
VASLYKPPGVHIESAGDRYIPLERVDTGVAGILGVSSRGPRNQPVLVGTYEQYAKVFAADESHLSMGVRGFFDNGGKKAYVINVAAEGGLDPTPDDYIGAQGGGERGLVALERIDDVDLIVAPDLVSWYKRSVGFPSLDHVKAVQRAMIEHCERLHDRFAILDMPQDFKPDEALEWRRQFDTSHAAIYYPWVKTRVGNDVSAPIPPSGLVAGMYAATDRAEGVHRAPANLKLEGLIDVSTRIKKRERDRLFDHGVNTLASFPGRGFRPWGGRTMSSDSAWKQINVRRLFINIRKSIERYTQWVVFEPNEPTLWKRITHTVEVFLRDYYRQGALLGAQAEEAFYVKCDEETNPPESRDAGMLICEIGIAPVRPAEYIIVRIHQFTRERTEAGEPEAAAPAATG